MAEMRRTARKGATLAAAVLGCLLLLAPASFAQTVPGGDQVAVPGTDQTGPVGDAVKDTGDTAGGAVDDASDTVGDAVKDTGGTVGDTVDNVEDGTTGTNVGDTVKDTSGNVGDTVKDTGGTVGNSVKDTTSGAGNQLDGAIDDVTDGTGLNEVIGGKGNKKDRPGSLNGAGKKDGNKSGLAVKSKSLTKQQRESQLGERASSTSSPLGASGGAEAEEELAGLTQAASFAPAFTIDEAIRKAVEAVKAFAFPIALSLLVIGFMLVQNKVDEKDPKLALAAVDTADELLSFG